MGRSTAAALRIGTGLLIAAGIGCAHGTLTPIKPGMPSLRVGKVAAVSVVLDPAVEADRRAVFDEIGASNVITGEIVTRLERDGRYDRAGDARVDVKVTVFRLRSTGNAFWNGFFAGIDMLEGTVDVTRGTEPPAQYAFVLSGSEDVYFKFSRLARFRSLARALAGKVSAAL